MIEVTRCYRFSASHRLAVAALSQSANRALYGKCNHPHGHGHDYRLEVSVRGPLDESSGRVVDPRALDRLVRRQVLEVFEHCDLNQAPDFQGRVPTTENLARTIWRRLQQAWPETFPDARPRLVRLRLRETRRNIFEMMEER